MRIRAFAISLALVSAFMPVFSPSPADAASLAILQASAVIPAGAGVCVFDTGGPYSINFPTAFNPVAPVPLTTASTTLSVTCKGLAGAEKVVILDRMDGTQLFLRNGEGKIPYSLNLPFSQRARNGKPAPVTLTATIVGTAYQNAPAGSYSDTITINVLP